jgi:hypothetical protein
MSEFGRRFDPSELATGDPGGNGDADAAELLAMARDLEWFAASESVSPSADFEDRVMAALASEPPPRTVGAGGLIGLVTLVRDAWHLTWSGGRPLAVRAQALAFVLLAAVALGSLGTLGVVGVGRLLSPVAPPPTPAPSLTPTPSVVPSPSPSVSPMPTATPTPTPTATPTPTSTATPTQGTAQPTKTAEPTETGDDSSGPGSGGTPRPTDDSSGPGSGSDDDSSGPGSVSESDSSGEGSGSDD